MPLLSVTAAPMPLTERDLRRLWNKVVKGSGPDACWGWLDAPSKDGYAYFAIGGRKGKKVLVHRLLYELAVGLIPEGQDLDHTCRNRLCVRPDHQEPVSRRINLLRGNTNTAKHASATHCPQGHPYDLFNTGYYCGRRYCKVCSNRRRGQRRTARGKEGSYLEPTAQL